MESDRTFSVCVSRALDCLGKSQDMIKFRVDKYNILERGTTSINNVIYDRFITGSKGEGLTPPSESDMDIMYVSSQVICADDTSSLNHIPGITVFETERRCTFPGYTQLRLAIHGVSDMFFPFCESLIKDENEFMYFSSDFFIQGNTAHFRITDSNHRIDRSGPSIQSYWSLSGWTIDSVMAFPCICPQMTQSFMKRHRDFGWPSNEQLIEISSFEGHVVPVGYKGSDTAFIEWRICYTEAERFLMRSLNDTQTKLYLLLKMIAKTYLNFISKDITSYVLKNVVLWLAESKDRHTFRTELLVDTITQALDFLRTCINENNLPSYMIPERNLFSEKFDKVQRQKLVFCLTELMNEGGGVLMGCERLRDTMIVLYKEPSKVMQYRCKRDTLEKLYLFSSAKFLETFLSGASVEEMIMLTLTDKHLRASIHILVPENFSLRLQGYDFPSRYAICMRRFFKWML